MPRTVGKLSLSSKEVGARSGLDQFRTQGAMKALFARSNDVQAILINTSGGLTGGDTLDLNLTAGENSQLTATTQAAERAYRAQSGMARVTTHLTVNDNAQLNWLPQELILFEGSALHRTLKADLTENARLLMVEPVVFGRTAMGETLTDIQFHDRIDIRRNGTPIYKDGLDLTGDMTQHLARCAIGQGAGAMASLVYIAPDAESHLKPIQSQLPPTAGASLREPDMLVLRMIAADSFELRRSLLPILDRLSRDGLPTSWRL